MLIVQVAGSKHWRRYGVDVPFPVKGGHSPKMTEPIWDGVLNVGDVLYLPRGEVHAAVPVQRPSVHLTIGILEKTGVDFMTWLNTAAEREEKLRMNLARNAPAQQRALREEELKQALHALIDATPLAEYIADVDRKRAPRSVASLNFAQRLTPDSELVSALLRGSIWRSTTRTSSNWKSAVARFVYRISLGARFIWRLSENE
ncbi:MAG: cupin domain-containing protein [Pseudolabrys sp.]